MRIELLYFDGCPGHEAFLPRHLYLTSDGLRGAPPDEWALNALQHAGRPAG